MTNLQKTIVKYKAQFAFLLLFFYGCMKSWMNALSVIADNARNNLTFNVWEPFVWEFSSFVVMIVLVPLIYRAYIYYPLCYDRFKKHVVVHLFNSILFSLIHVIGMVIIRKIIYFFNSSYYDFGHWPSELFYEYRKDIFSYLFLLMLIYIYQHFINQIEGIASLIKERNEMAGIPVSPEKTNKDKILIKKKGQEFIVDLSQISTVESGGNYVYIHTNKQVYPMRKTMIQIQTELAQHSFVRVHRSYIVNINFIKEINTSELGDYNIILTNNKTIPLSRKYRKDLIKIFEI